MPANRRHLVELLRDKICTEPEPTVRRRSRTRISLPLPLPLRRLRVSSRDPRRRLWSNGRFNVRITLAKRTKQRNLSKEYNEEEDHGGHGQVRKRSWESLAKNQSSTGLTVEPLRSLDDPDSSSFSACSRFWLSWAIESTSSICSGTSTAGAGGAGTPFLRSLACSASFSHRSLRACSRCSALFCRSL